MTTITDTNPRPLPTFSELIRSTTWGDHERAEQSPYLGALVAGELDLEAYAVLVDQHWHIYTVLEQASSAMTSDAIAGLFATPTLNRLGSLESDLTALRGADWRGATHALPSTDAYCERLREVCFTWPGGFVAHHYTRYLGDLSGGVYIGRAIERVFGFGNAPGASFYRFDAIEDPAAFKNDYRARLDAARWEPDEQERIIAEIGIAYSHNSAVLDDLAMACVPAGH